MNNGIRGRKEARDYKLPPNEVNSDGIGQYDGKDDQALDRILPYDPNIATKQVCLNLCLQTFMFGTIIP